MVHSEGNRLMQTIVETRIEINSLKFLTLCNGTTVYVSFADSSDSTSLSWNHNSHSRLHSAKRQLVSYRLSAGYCGN
jgi:hypothetical protein